MIATGNDRDGEKIAPYTALLRRSIQFRGKDREILGGITIGRRTMKKVTRNFAITALVVIAIGAAPLWAQELAGRKELRRTGLEGSPGMEVGLSVVELKPGDEMPAHFHHGVETGYVLEGGMVEMPGKAATAMPEGAPILNERGVVHGGFKVVGDKTVKLVSVHVVDKGRPLYDWVGK